MTGHGGKLTRKQDQAIAALLTCPSILDAALIWRPHARGTVGAEGPIGPGAICDICQGPKKGETFPKITYPQKRTREFAGFVKALKKGDAPAGVMALGTKRNN